MFDPTRRQFLLTTSISAAGCLLSAPLRAVAMESFSAKDQLDVHSQRLDSGWQFRRRTIGDIREAWQSEQNSLWEATELPHCFNGMDACDPDQSYFRGQGWYRTGLLVRNPFDDGRTILHFQGAGQTTTLWVGSTLIGSHKGGYDEFAFDITDAIRRLPLAETRDGARIAVCCDNTPDQDRVPSEHSDFCLYGGLYRHVSLVYLPALALDAVHITPTVASDGSTQVVIQSRLYNPSSLKGPCNISVEVSDGQGRSIHRSSQTLSVWSDFAPLAKFRVASPDLWSPEVPSLYSCLVTLSSPAGQTSLEERFGIRKTEFVDHGPFKLNGKRVLLRGTHRHADHAGVAAAMSDDLVREEMRKIREMGANFIRLAHYQQDRLVLELCDELGLMVWEEVPWCRAGVGNESFKKNVEDMLCHMIDQHYNHPSIILWGLGNEDDWPEEYPRLDQLAIRAFMTQIRDLAHHLDSSRLTAVRRCDFACDIPDVYSPSIWAGWYRGNFREYEKSLDDWRNRVKHLIHMEWGADSHAGRHSEDPEAVLSKVTTGTGTDERDLDYVNSGGAIRASKDGDWSETYACDLFDWHLKAQEKMDWFTGSAQWVFKDFASPLRTDNPIPRVNQKGLVERDLTPKESYYVFQSFWTEKPMVHILGHSWPIRWGKTGEERNVHIYSNCDHAELFLNGISQGTMHRDSQNFPAAGLRWKVIFAAGRNQLRAVAIKNGVTVTDEISLIYQTETWGEPVELRLFETVRKDNLITIEAKVFDAKGVLCLDSTRVIRFSLAGESRLVDNLGTTRASRELQLANGRAQISLIHNGSCRVQATVEGLSAATLNL